MDVNNQRKPLLYYWLIALLIMGVINMFFLPFMTKNTIEQVNYDVFLTQMQNKNISQAEVNEDVIYFYLKDEDKSDKAGTTIFSENTQKVYSTVRMDDPQLVERLYNAGASFGEVKPREVSPWFSTLVMFVVFFLLWQFVMKKAMSKMGGIGNAMSFGKSNAKVYVKAQTGKTFKDVAGQDEAKDALREIVDFLHNPQKYTEIGASMPKGALLVGPPGTGKTLLAQAVAGEAEVPFFSISGSEFVEMFVGMGAAKVRDLFKQANEKAPCIVFIDEIDTIGKKRDGNGMGGNDEREQTLNQLLTEMDGFEGNSGVIILAATNRPDSLDPALTRPGRFDRRVPVELPDLKGREEILKVHAKKVALAPGIDFNTVARMASGASGAELANIVNEAALRAVRAGRKSVTEADLEESIEVVIAGYQKKNSILTDKEKCIVAYHEVGHALVAAKQKNAQPVSKITIVPHTQGALGYTMQTPEEEKFLSSKEELIVELQTLLGGRAAEQIVFGIATTGASNDIERATELARKMVTQYGMSDKLGLMALSTVSNPYLDGSTMMNCADSTSSAADEEIHKLLMDCYEDAKRLLTEHRALLDEIAMYLLTKETITGDEFMTYVNAENKKLTDGSEPAQDEQDAEAPASPDVPQEDAPSASD